MTLSAVQRSGDGFHSNSDIEFFPAGRPVVLWRDARSCLDDVEFFHSDPDAYEADRRACLWRSYASLIAGCWQCVINVTFGCSDLSASSERIAESLLESL